MLSQRQIDLAVDWWGDALRTPVFDNGDKSANGSMAMMLATLGAPTVTDEQVGRFTEALRKSLAEGDEASRYGIGVDYGPDQVLGDALVSAGLNGGSITVLPWKTYMWFSDGEVRVQAGYGADIKVLE